MLNELSAVPTLIVIVVADPAVRGISDADPDVTTDPLTVKIIELSDAAGVTETFAAL